MFRSTDVRSKLRSMAGNDNTFNASKSPLTHPGGGHDADGDQSPHLLMNAAVAAAAEGKELCAASLRPTGVFSFPLSPMVTTACPVCSALLTLLCRFP